MNKKFPKKRLDILNNYKQDVMQFLKFNIFAMFACLLIFKVLSKTEEGLFVKLILVGIWLILIILAYFKSYNKNYLLLMSSILILVYSLTLKDGLLDMIFMFTIASFLYEIVLKFWLGLYFHITPKEYSWSFQKEVRIPKRKRKN